jgi:alkanesulfonate monooxygenase SsuD/methylene tetrahydromethanopterin reductase-like flavin-dependent oxidoreductase (luciferase family)
VHVGVVTLGDWLCDPSTGERPSEAARFAQFVELGVVAEGLGFHAFHVGEHHFSEYVLSSPAMVLLAVADRTSAIRLSTAVSLLTHHDPVRIAEDYATVDVLSGGRVELVAGRGVYQTHYRQFGQDWEQSEELLAEAVVLLRRLWTEEGVSWSGLLRPPLDDVTVHPRPLQRPHPRIWLSASSPASVQRAIALRCPIVIPTISTGVELPPLLAAEYRQGWAAAGLPPDDAGIALHVHAYVGPGTTEAARERWLPHQTSYLSWVLRDVRGWDGPLPPHMATLGEPDSQAVCGDAGDVAADLQRRIGAMGGVDVLLIQSDQGGLPEAEVHASLERFATEVMPALDDVPSMR